MQSQTIIGTLSCQKLVVKTLPIVYIKLQHLHQSAAEKKCAYETV